MNLNGSGVLSLICTKGAVVTASPSSGGSSLTGSGGSLSYSLYTDSGMTSKWGAGIQNLSFTGGAGATSNTALTSYFSKSYTYNGDLTLAQIQSMAPGFNPNLFYYYHYEYNNNDFTNSVKTTVYYGYLGQFSSTPTGAVVGVINKNAVSVNSNNSPYPNQNLTVTSTAPLPGYYGYYTNYYDYYIIPPGTTTGTTSTYGTSYQVPSSTGTTALKGTSTTVTQPVNLTYYASLPYGQNVAPGVYTDTVVIQVTF